MELKEITIRANELFQELKQQKSLEENTTTIVESFRISCIDKITKFFQEIAENTDMLKLHIIGDESTNEIKHRIVLFGKAPSPIVVEYVCLNAHINVPNWFKLVCEKYLDVDFIQASSDSLYYEDNWMLQEVSELKKQMSAHQSENEDLFQVLEKLIFATQRMNLLGADSKAEFAEIELQGLIMVLLEDFSIFGWDIASNIGEEHNDKRFLNVYLDKEVYVNALEPIKILREKHPLAKVYEIMKNSIHKANEDYLSAIINGTEPSVRWKFFEVGFTKF